MTNGTSPLAAEEDRGQDPLINVAMAHGLAGSFPRRASQRKKIQSVACSWSLGIGKAKSSAPPDEGNVHTTVLTYVIQIDNLYL
jgi:hypothetical protein